MKEFLVQLAFDPFLGWFQVPENRILGTLSASNTQKLLIETLFTIWKLKTKRLALKINSLKSTDWNTTCFTYIFENFENTLNPEPIYMNGKYSTTNPSVNFALFRFFGKYTSIKKIVVKFTKKSSKSKWLEKEILVLRYFLMLCGYKMVFYVLTCLDGGGLFTFHVEKI